MPKTHQHIDWDARRRKRRSDRTPPTMDVFGETITLPFGIPAGLALDLMEAQEEAGPEADLEDAIGPDQIVRMLKQVFGADRIDVWRKREDLDLEDLADLLEAAMTLMSGEAAPDDDEESDGGTDGEAA